MDKRFKEDSKDEKMNDVISQRGAKGSKKMSCDKKIARFAEPFTIVFFKLNYI